MKPVLLITMLFLQVAYGQRCLELGLSYNNYLKKAGDSKEILSHLKKVHPYNKTRLPDLLSSSGNEKTDYLNLITHEYPKIISHLISSDYGKEMFKRYLVTSEIGIEFPDGIHKIIREMGAKKRKELFNWVDSFSENGRVSDNLKMLNSFFNTLWEEGLSQYSKEDELFAYKSYSEFFGVSKSVKNLMKEDGTVDFEKLDVIRHLKVPTTDDPEIITQRSIDRNEFNVFYNYVIVLDDDQNPDFLITPLVATKEDIIPHYSYEYKYIDEPNRHHHIVSRGKDVLYAGEVSFEPLGSLYYITLASGHYMTPRTFEFDRAISAYIRENFGDISVDEEEKLFREFKIAAADIDRKRLYDILTKKFGIKVLDPSDKYFTRVLTDKTEWSTLDPMPYEIDNPDHESMYYQLYDYRFFTNSELAL